MSGNANPYHHHPSSIPWLYHRFQLLAIFGNKFFIILGHTTISIQRISDVELLRVLFIEEGINLVITCVHCYSSSWKSNQRLSILTPPFFDLSRYVGPNATVLMVEGFGVWLRHYFSYVMIDENYGELDRVLFWSRLDMVREELWVVGNSLSIMIMHIEMYIGQHAINSINPYCYDHYDCFLMQIDDICEEGLQKQTLEGYDHIELCSASWVG